ncbi:MAG: hypothetical protein V4501_08390 [Pseudomonadota bacterium]
MVGHSRSKTKSINSKENEEYEVLEYSDGEDEISADLNKEFEEGKDEISADVNKEFEEKEEVKLKEGHEAEFLKLQIETFQAKLQELAFVEEVEASKLTLQLQNEAAGIMGKKCLKLIEIVHAKIELLNNMINLESMQRDFASAAEMDFHNDFANRIITTSILAQARGEYREALSVTIDKFKKMTLQLLKTPSHAIPAKDLQLILDTTANLYQFSETPDQENMARLIDNAKQINKKMGTFWSRIKTALTTVIGIGCIIVGALGVVPSFGASASLIAVGTLLCGYAHAPGFLNTQAHQKRKDADETSHNIQNLLNQAKKLSAIPVNRWVEDVTLDSSNGYGYF